MGFVRDDISKYWNTHEEVLYFHKTEGVTLDPFLYYEVPNFLTPDECRTLTRVIEEHEPHVLELQNHSTKPYEGLTKQHTVYNWLNHPEFNSLNIAERLLNTPPFQNIHATLVQCWCNILRQGKGLLKHCHQIKPQNALYACNIFVSGNPNTGTHYYKDGLGYTRNEVGTLTILGQQLEHEVKTNIYPQNRISIAMDTIINPDKVTLCDGFDPLNRYVYYRNDGVSDTHECTPLWSSTR